MRALYNISYGIYILSAKDKKHNACVINTLIQVTSNPERVSITVNKDNYTTKMIEKTGVFNVSILDQTTSFDLIKRFGFASGKNVDKFDGFKNFKIAKNGVSYITESTNSYISAKVIDKIDVGTHITFIADLTEEKVLSSSLPATYAFYQSNIKPKPEVKFKKVYVCRVCGYIYQGDNLPEDFVCPICKHGADAFELVEQEVQEKKTIENQVKQGSKQFYCPECGNMEKGETAGTCVICGAKMLEL